MSIGNYRARLGNPRNTADDHPSLRRRLQHPSTSVLIVDDSPSFRSAARELLERRGYLIAGEADCAHGGLQAATRLRPDAVLLDLGLPDGHGADVARQLAASHPGVAILLVSADLHEDSTDLLSRTGARGVVHKHELARTDFSRFWPTRLAS